MVFRGLKFEHNDDIGQNSHLWMGTIYIFVFHKEISLQNCVFNVE
jgi:hypothetical protein